MSIEWKECAVCFADGQQWFVNFNSDRKKYQLKNFRGGMFFSFYGVINFAKNFQLNTIKQGDYIEASELDTEQKYNNVVEVFELFGFKPYERDSKEALRPANKVFFVSGDLLFIGSSGCSELTKRKLTYPQIMAIGELKRLEIERSAPKTAPDLTPDLVNNQEARMQKNKPVVAQVMIDLTERMEIGIKTYGEALRANNGRDALQDAYEEALDLACYLKQAMIERDNENTN